MKKYLSCLIFIISCINMVNGQSWSELARANGPVKFNRVVTEFENQKNQEIAANHSREKSKIAKPFENKDHLFYKWYLFNKTRLNAEGNTTNVLWRTLEAETSQQQTSTAENLLPHGSWESLGPANINSTILNPFTTGLGVGRVNSITFSGGNLFLGTAGGGAWKGTGNNTWQSISENISYLSVSSICINPLNTSVIYILTGDGDGNGNGPSNTSIGVIKSMDGGISWSPTGLVWTSDVNQKLGFKMVMHPVNPETLFVAASSGIYRTLDGGTTWDNTPGYFTDIEFKPGTPGYMYAVSTTHFYLTTTSGNGWSQQSQPVFSNPISRMAIAVSANRPNWVYVLAGYTWAQPFFVGLWLSTNSGITFGTPRSSATPPIFSDNSNTYSQADYDIAFTANPADAKEIWMGGINVYNSLDSGTTWSKRSSYYTFANDIMHPDIHALEYNSAGELWCGNDGGIFKYTPASVLTKWEIQFEGLNVAQYYRLGMDPTPPYDLSFFGAQDNGIQRYDGDANNENVDFGDGGEIAVDYIDNKFYYNMNSLLKKSSLLFGADITPPTAMCNCKDTSYNKNAGLYPNRPIKIDPINHDIIYHGLECLWISLNEGNNFNVVTGFDCTDGMINDVDITTVSKWAVKDHTVLRETTPGVWTNVTNDLIFNTEIITRIAAHTTNPLEAYVSYGGYNSTIKVFYTTDGGTNWNNLSGGLPNTPINDILYQNGSDGGYYAATDIGVYYVNNNMFFWTPFRNGMPSVVVTELEINYGQNKIFASTYGRGGWVSELISPCPATDETAFYPSLPSYSTIQVNNTLTANSKFINGYGQNVTLLSGLEINFPVGFEASNGSVMTARIQNCPALKQTGNSSYQGNLFYKEQNNTQIPGQERHLAISDFSLWPNPAKEYCRLDISIREQSNLKIEIINLAGIKTIQVAEQFNMLPGNYRFSIPVKLLQNGIYFIKTTYGNSVHTDKLVVQN